MSEANNKSHEALVADWKKNAKKHDDLNYRFLRSLKMRSPKKVDADCSGTPPESVQHCELYDVRPNCCRTMRDRFHRRRHRQGCWAPGDCKDRVYCGLTCSEMRMRDSISPRRSHARSWATTANAPFTKCGQRNARDTLSPTSQTFLQFDQPTPAMPWSARPCSTSSSR